MAVVLGDRVKEESSNAAGTSGAFQLDGADTNFQTFVSGVGNGNECFYCCFDASNWEIGRGTVTDGTPDTLSRDTILDSSAAGSAVNWGSSIKKVFTSIPASQILLAANNLSDVSSTSTALSNLGGLGAAGGTVTGTLTIGTGGALSISSGATSFTADRLFASTSGITTTGGAIEVDRTGDVATGRMAIDVDSGQVCRYEMKQGGTLTGYLQGNSAADTILVAKESDGVTNAAYIVLKSTTNAGQVQIWEESEAAGGAGTVRRVDAFPSGTSMWFFQATAPSGWSLNTTGAGDYALTSYSVNAGTFQGSSWSGTTGNTSGAEFASHSHNFVIQADFLQTGSTQGITNVITSGSGTTRSTQTTSSATTHSHSYNTRPLKDARGRICDKD